MTHINRILIVLSVLTAIIPLSVAALLIEETHNLSAAMIWWMY